MARSIHKTSRRKPAPRRVDRQTQFAYRLLVLTSFALLAFMLMVSLETIQREGASNALQHAATGRGPIPVVHGY